VKLHPPARPLPAVLTKTVSLNQSSRSWNILMLRPAPPLAQSQSCPNANRIERVWQDLQPTSPESPVLIHDATPRECSTLRDRESLAAGSEAARAAKLIQRADSFPGRMDSVVVDDETGARRSRVDPASSRKRSQSGPAFFLAVLVVWSFLERTSSAPASRPFRSCPA
jgi:hypothetical protein